VLILILASALAALGNWAIAQAYRYLPVALAIAGAVSGQFHDDGPHRRAPWRRTAERRRCSLHRGSYQRELLSSGIRRRIPARSKHPLIGISLACLNGVLFGLRLCANLLFGAIVRSLPVGLRVRTDYRIVASLSSWSSPRFGRSCRSLCFTRRQFDGDTRLQLPDR